MEEISRREKEAGIKPDVDVDAFMKVSDCFCRNSVGNSEFCWKRIDKVDADMGGQNSAVKHLHCCCFSLDKWTYGITFGFGSLYLVNGHWQARSLGGVTSSIATEYTLRVSSKSHNLSCK
jgi:hypothetical protein